MALVASIFAGHITGQADDEKKPYRGIHSVHQHPEVGRDRHRNRDHCGSVDRSVPDAVKPAHCLQRRVPTLGEFAGQRAKAFEIDQANLLEYFKVGMSYFNGIWKNIIEPRDFEIIRELFGTDRGKKFLMPVESWVRIVYRYANTFHRTPRQRFKVLDTLTPFYYGRVGSLVNELRDKAAEEAETHFEDNALVFESMKDCLIELWEGKEK